MKITLFLSLIGIFFAACEQTKSVEYYQNHPEEAKKRSLECRHKAIISQDCVNAYKIGFPKDEWEALENVLIPYSQKENLNMLEKAGFKKIESIFKWANFETFIAFKD